MKKIIILAALAAALPVSAAQMANPASVNCIRQGGKLEIEKSPNGEYGVCILDNNRKCEEWSLFRGECPSDGVAVSSAATEQEAYCLITGGEVSGKNCSYASGACALDNISSSGCARGMSELPGEKGAFLRVYGGGWLASDYIDSALKTAQLARAHTGEVSFQIKQDGKKLVMFQGFNFHEACGYEIAEVAKTKDGYDLQINLHPDDNHCAPQNRDYADGKLVLRVMTAKGDLPEVIARGVPSGGAWRMYTRVPERGDTDSYQLFAGFAADYLLAGKYATAKGATVEFSPGGQGDWSGKDFTYTVDVDYVLGPECNILRFDGNAPVKGPVSFEKSFDGAVLLYKVGETNKNGSGFLCTKKLLETLTPVK